LSSSSYRDSVGGQSQHNLHGFVDDFLEEVGARLRVRVLLEHHPQLVEHLPGVGVPVGHVSHRQELVVHEDGEDGGAAGEDLEDQHGEDHDLAHGDEAEQLQLIGCDVVDRLPDWLRGVRSHDVEHLACVTAGVEQREQGDGHDHHGHGGGGHEHQREEKVVTAVLLHHQGQVVTTELEVGHSLVQTERAHNPVGQQQTLEVVSLRCCRRREHKLHGEEEDVESHQPHRR